VFVTCEEVKQKQQERGAGLEGCVYALSNQTRPCCDDRFRSD
jgi:hypothetical protein